MAIRVLPLPQSPCCKVLEITKRSTVTNDFVFKNHVLIAVNYY